MPCVAWYLLRWGRRTTAPATCTGYPRMVRGSSGKHSMATQRNNPSPATVPAVPPAAAKAAPATVPAVPPAVATAAAAVTVPAGDVGVALAAGVVAVVHGVAFVVPVAGNYRAPRGANVGWPTVPAGSSVHACAAVQLATATAAASDATIVVHNVPAKPGCSTPGARAGHYIARPYTGAQRWSLHPTAPKA